jgi:hypothetical protein
VADTKISDSQLQVPLPDTLPPGVYPIQVLQDVQAGKSTVLVKVLESNVMAFVRQPRIAGPVTVTPGMTVTLAIPLDIAVRATQRVKLLLDERAPVPGQPARSYQVDAPFPLGVQPTLQTLQIGVPGVAAAEYLIRVQVDGTQSPLDVGPAGFTGPVVNIPAGGGP